MNFDQFSSGWKAFDKFVKYELPNASLIYRGSSVAEADQFLINYGPSVYCFMQKSNGGIFLKPLKNATTFNS
jgi:hypothetical protein